MPKVELFGGAVSSCVPAGFVDVSEFRQVPDHQEVFANARESDDSLIFELMERVEGSDEEALREHLQELAVLNQSQVIPLVTEKAVAPLLPEGENGAYFTSIIQKSHKWGRIDVVKEGGGLESLVFILAYIVRLKKVSTDILITYNIPLTTKEEVLEALNLEKDSNPGAAIKSRIDTAKTRIDESFKNFNVHDWGLFIS
ncbi:nuclear import protein Mog1p [Trichomonascus vanleenenianus]|uniref:Ran GTPase-binding protein MOG1 n=1 Tax=Trichomonascus vanleenenianus TaxID=2268995 RepID=UPI003ECA3342